MTWGVPRNFPRAIVHIDGDSFFAACEVAKDPTLRGKPVITGQERGIVSACTYEAKRRGVMRGMQLRDVRRVCPDAIILPSDYETYSIFSRRMYEIVRRYTPAVEEYSIDECFADLTGMRRVNRMDYAATARSIQHDLARELGITFSIGLSATKTLAKIGSKWQKPAGLTIIPLREAPQFLRGTPIEKIWGIGPNTAAYLAKFGIRTAFDFTARSEEWVASHLSKPFIETWRELRGEVALELDTDGRATYQSIAKTKTFTPPSTDPVFVFAQLSKNIENACIKARRWGLTTRRVFFFLKTQAFAYRGAEIRLPVSTAVPHDILHAVSADFPRVFRRGTQYRATGITLLDLERAERVQLDLFGAQAKTEALSTVFSNVDAMCERFGKHAVFLASSTRALRGTHRGARGEAPAHMHERFVGETARKRLGVPYLGFVA